MSSYLSHLYKDSLSLLTDLYQLTMAYGYWHSNTYEYEAVFNLSFRRAPFAGEYVVATGLEIVIDYLQRFRYEQSDLDYLATLVTADQEPLFKADFLNYLAKLRFSCDVEAVPEGSIVFPHEPVLRVKGPLLQCQLLETSLLNIINFQSLIATKASRLLYATKGEDILEFGTRRAQGMDGAIAASRAAYIGGCAATSNVLAGKLFNIPVRGTHAHSWIMSFDDELMAFQKYAEAFPANAVFLVDTYDTLEGVKHAIEIGRWLEKQGQRLIAVRLDSGDLAYLSSKARELLDAAGFQQVAIIASGDLDERVIQSLKEQHAQINIWGVGTRLVTAYDQPALEGVYKLSALRKPQQQWEYKLKLSEQTAKISTPGLLKVRRYYDGDIAVADAIYDEQLGIAQDCFIVDPNDPLHRKHLSANLCHEELLKPIFQAGKQVYQSPTIQQIQQTVKNNLQQIHESTRRFLNPHRYPVGLEERLYDHRMKLINKLRHSANE